MAKTDAWYLGVRAEQLATIYLTRRNDVAVVKQEQDYTPDLLIALLENGANTGRYFGIEVKAAVSEHSATQNGDVIEVKWDRVNYQLYRDTPFPVCLFFFTMEDDRGYWKWIREPAFDQGSSPTLITNQSAVLTPLTDPDLDMLITRIKRWYEQSR